MDRLDQVERNLPPLVERCTGAIGCRDPEVGSLCDSSIELPFGSHGIRRGIGRAVNEMHDGADAFPTRREGGDPACLAARIATVVDVESVRPKPSEEPAQPHIVRECLLVAEARSPYPRCGSARPSLLWFAVVASDEHRFAVADQPRVRQRRECDRGSRKVRRKPWRKPLIERRIDIAAKDVEKS